jgi:hypothetical protein
MTLLTIGIFTVPSHKQKMNEHVCSSKERSKDHLVIINGFEILNFIADSTLSRFYHCYAFDVIFDYMELKSGLCIKRSKAIITSNISNDAVVGASIRMI